jgi:hypothetical protein
MRDRLMTVLVTGAFLEIVWTIYLGWRLPRHYVANHWDLAWVGLDVAEIVTLLGAAWSAWRRRFILIFFLVASGTLLLLDAWFDITTAGHGDVRQSVLVAIFIEVPSSLALLWMARRVTRRWLVTRYPSGNFDSTPVRKIPLSPKSGDY